MMATSTAAVGSVVTQASGVPQRQHWTIADKRRIVEETLVTGTSVARVARAHGVNANQVFYWRKLYQKGRLGAIHGAKLLPVTVTRESLPSASLPGECASSGPCSPGEIHIELRHAQVRIEGKPDPAVLRVVLEYLCR
jgi:transposase